MIKRRWSMFVHPWRVAVDLERYQAHVLWYAEISAIFERVK